MCPLGPFFSPGVSATPNPRNPSSHPRRPAQSPIPPNKARNAKPPTPIFRLLHFGPQPQSMFRPCRPGGAIWPRSSQRSKMGSTHSLVDSLLCLTVRTPVLLIISVGASFRRMAVAANFEAMPRVDQIRVDYFAAHYRRKYEGASFANVLDLKVKYCPV